MFLEGSRTKILSMYSAIITFLVVVLLLYIHSCEVETLKTLRVDTPTPLVVRRTPSPFPSLPPTPTFKIWTTTQVLTSQRSCSNYVIFSNAFRDGRGLGNQMFGAAAGILISQLTGRQLAMNSSVLADIYLEDLFDYKYDRVSMRCEIFQIDDKWNLAYNPDVEFLDSQRKKDFVNKTIVLSGFFQSWKYTINERLLRDKYFNIKDQLKTYVFNFFDNIMPSGWRPDTFTRVGIHVRRGDVLTQHSVEFGYTTPEASYFKKAMLYMLDLYKRVQFIVLSTDHSWSENNLNTSLFKDVKSVAYTYNITHVTPNNNRSVDMAILASCHHSVISTGTFGWWGAWLSRGTTVYYKDWPKPNSSLFNKFKKEDFFPPGWVGL